MNRRFLFYLSVFICAVLCAGFVRREDDPLKTLLLKLEKYKSANVFEKIHVHTDKPYYSIGDTIWFKIYTVNSERNQLSGLSKIVYADLINEKDSIKKSLRIPLVSGLAWGDFVLADSLREGNYRIRAYTAWMRNYGEDYYFDKTIQIGNSLSNQLVSNVKYSFNKIGIRENVTADITFQDINGNPIANKEVNYTVQLDFRNIHTGKGITDEKGGLQIKFTNAQPFVLKSGRINTTVKLTDKTSVNKVFPVKSTSSETDVQFFPESGQLVNSVVSKVAFKAVGSDGLSRNISGYIADKENNKITEFSSEHAGMGVFSIVPVKDNSYKAVIKFEDGSEKQLELPKAANEGFVLSVNNSNPENIFIKVIASEGNINSGDLTLVAQTNGVVQFVTKNKLNNSIFTGALPRKRFPAGILKLTLFSAEYKPVAERLLFIQPKPVSVELSSSKAAYGSKEQAELSIRALDSAGKAMKGNFSLSVINETLVPFDDTKETTILSNLLLTSDLKGHIENPNYYFTEVNAGKNRHLDYLMLTQGWRRYTWESIINNTYPSTVYVPERDITITGRVTNASGKPIAGGKVILLPSKGSSVIMDTITSADGRFSFPHLSFSDSTAFVLQARDSKNRKNVYIEIDRLAPQLVTKNKHAAELEVNVNQNMLAYLKARANDFDLMRKNGMLRKSILLAEVKIAEKKPAITNSSNLNGAGNADAIIKADRFAHCLNLAQCLQGMVAGLVIQNGIAYLTRSMYSSFSGLVPMQLIVDGIYLEPEYLNMISPVDVESIEVLKSIGNTAIYGIRGGGGVLIINTKRGERNLSYRSMSPGIASYIPQGLYTAKEFYSPVYAKPEQDGVLPDFRNTIYWNPNILTDDNGKAMVKFYTADEAATYKATLEGLSFDGTLVRKVFRFKVQ